MGTTDKYSKEYQHPKSREVVFFVGVLLALLLVIIAGVYLYQLNEGLPEHAGAVLGVCSKYC